MFVLELISPVVRINSWLIKMFMVTVANQTFRLNSALSVNNKINDNIDDHVLGVETNLQAS